MWWITDAKEKSNNEKTKAVQTNFNEINITSKIAVSIYCYLIKYKSKLLPFHVTNNEPREVLYW